MVAFLINYFKCWRSLHYNHLLRDFLSTYFDFLTFRTLPIISASVTTHALSTFPADSIFSSISFSLRLLAGCEEHCVSTPQGGKTSLQSPGHKIHQTILKGMITWVIPRTNKFLNITFSSHMVTSNKKTSGSQKGLGDQGDFVSPLPMFGNVWSHLSLSQGCGCVCARYLPLAGCGLRSHQGTGKFSTATMYFSKNVKRAKLEKPWYGGINRLKQFHVVNYIPVWGLTTWG